MLDNLAMWTFSEALGNAEYDMETWNTLYPILNDIITFLSFSITWRLLPSSTNFTISLSQ